ncbi:type IV secretory system conjugative DNA transfer family protein [Flavonifractor plautii]|uniref:Type IV secretory system conjugative DNA transfer family protein n=6 Tax=Clostridia TaxID=186801 RepID=A0AAW6C056_FLAPL|nr:type IV secretory system conjugative DNA transfer family protein [Flavonifractor plautii]MCB6874724.1 type IV secretory system conjugative DNA transfer family protein [Flavonifractor plautii]MCQ4659213.1 type IV secretory system conjugative DNA transfer family protein [Flavonifractor plautii]MCQ4684802.1 type IV secretory system conjugative DNA transfer family protein [Flavonifractor plautii]MCQ4719157.1 type IV secretory system conjugative DNA transfer family protein [Flavonifractor plautii
MIAVNNDTWMLILLLAVVFGALVAITTFSGRGSLDSIKSKTVGDGQHGTARWATQGEIKKTFRSVPFQTALWRKGERLPGAQGLVLGCTGKKGQLTALVDSDDIHCLMIGASGVGKTAFFLYPNLEYACASGMSFFASDTKGDLARNYGAIARDCYGYQVAVVDLRNPTRSDGYNLLTLINHYMDACRRDPADLAARAKAEKYAKILSKTVINPDEENFAQNQYFYDAAEGVLTAVILLLAEYLPPKRIHGELRERRHIVSVFKLVQELLAPSILPGKNEFQLLMDRLPEEHKAKWFSGSALTAAEQSMASVMSTVLSRLNTFLDSELEQVLCFDSTIDAESFAAKKSAIFLILPEEDQTKNFMAGLMIQTLSRELFSVADEHDGKLPSRVVFFCDELGTMPAFDILPLFSAGRSRRLTLVPIIQSLAQLEKNYGKEGAEILTDNCQDTIFGGFAPNSQTAEVLSKALGNRTVLSGSISRGKNDPSQSLQMIERPLMTPDELKSIPKGHFIVMKTGTHPMQTRLRLFLEWGITFGEPYQVSQQAARKVYYASKAELTDVIYRAFPASARQNNYRTPKKEKTIP